MSDEDVEGVLNKYREKLEKDIAGKKPEVKPIVSREYTALKKEFMPQHMNWYEKGCNYSEKILKIALSMKESSKRKKIVLIKQNVIKTVLVR